MILLIGETDHWMPRQACYVQLVSSAVGHLGYMKKKMKNEADACECRVQKSLQQTPGHLDDSHGH